MMKQSRNNKVQVVDIEGYIVHRPASGLSIIFSTEEVARQGVVLPLSLIEIEEQGGRKVTVTMPEWLAHEKRLI